MRLEKEKNLVNELYIYTVITLVGGTFFGFFYGIFLYRNTFNINILLVDLLVSSIASLAGYFLGSYATHKKGYMATIRLSLCFAALSAIIAFFYSHIIAAIFIYIAIIKGLSGGIYASVLDIYLLKEMNQRVRGRYLYLNLSIEFLITTLVPILVGAILTFGGGYRLTFLIAGLLYFSAIWIPKQYNKKPNCKFLLSDAIAITKRAHFKEFGINLAMGSGADQLNVFVIAIVPYLIIKNEFGVGLLVGASAIVASLTSFFLKNINGKYQWKIGFAGGLGRFVGNVFLAFYWSLPVLVIRGLFNNVFAVFYDPAFHKVQIGNAEKLLGKEINRQALELVFVEAVLSFFGKAFAVVLFLGILAIGGNGQSLLIRLLLPLYGIWKIADYAWILSMQKRFPDRIEDQKIQRLPELEKAVI